MAFVGYPVGYDHYILYYILFEFGIKVMVDQPDVWYKKFSRNIHGLRGDKPYNNLEWPPTDPTK